MSSKGSIQICHSDETLVAEISFWAKSAGYELVALDSRADLLRDGSRNVIAAILELSGSGDEEVDVIEALTKKSRARVMAITQLDTKTVASLRRLFQAKSVDVILQGRVDFNTRHLADLLKRMEMYEEVAPKLVLCKTGRDCAIALIRGQAEIGITFTSEFIAVPGTRVVGTLPKEIEYVNGYAGAIPKDAAVEPARALLAFLGTPAAKECFKSYGLM